MLQRRVDLYAAALDYATGLCHIGVAAMVPLGEPAMTNIDTNEEEKREKVAEHEFIDVAGNEVDETETATGYRYTLVALPNEPFTWQWDQANNLERKLMALFGVKTLATNENVADPKRQEKQGPRHHARTT